MSTFCLCLDCQAGFNGGLPQTFLLEVRHNGLDLVANQSVTSRPFFKVLIMRFTHKYKAFRSQPVDSINDIPIVVIQKRRYFQKIIIIFLGGRTST